ncbi:MAG: DUF362 domain-containing protein [Deltaproteobacteria bacterium]|uniref:DUF362 domain-containing protein n=1 Tax=Candidatus Zymogenus saltonus TaxID=2844893 RepID=A0A9D8KBX6_9DELT|nr:DUF362 domain-containing protein [Candidatus Zymogenus saltonus]
MKVALKRVEGYNIKDVSEALADMFRMLGYDRENPLGHIVRPNDTVFIKPNWVAHEYRKSCDFDKKGDVYSVITHPSVIRGVVDYVAKALGGRGEIIIGDNPSIDADFSRLRDLVRLDDLEKMTDIRCRIVDLRPLVCTDLKDYGKKSKMKKQPGDPLGFTTVNLGRKSLFYDVTPLLYRGVFDSRWETVLHHFGRRHEYSFSNSIINADAYISIPKLKTHRKVGATLNIKGLVGTNSVKNYLVHWRVGFPMIGGDEYPDFMSWLKSKRQKVTHRGAWHGNDTAWRMVVDIYNAFAERVGRTFTVIDGIVAGEKNGPFCPQNRRANVLIASEDLLAADCAAARLMDFDIGKIKYLDYLINQRNIALNDIEVISEDFIAEDFFDSSNEYLRFMPPHGWENIALHR